MQINQEHNKRNEAHMKTHLKTIALIASVLTLTACGGGGGGETTVPKQTQVAPQPTQTTQPADTPLSVTASQTELTMGESTSQTVTFTYTGANGDVSLTAGNNEIPYWFSFSGDNKAMTFTVAELENEGEVTIELIAKDDKDTDTITLTFDAVNTSIQPILVELAAYREAVPSYLNQAEEVALAERALELAGMVDPDLTSSMKVQLMSALKSAIEGPASEGLIYATQQDVADEYASGTLVESTVVGALDMIKREEAAFTAAINEAIQPIMAAVPGGVLAPDTSTAYIVSELSSLSRFVGNPKFGELDDAGNWVFKPEYAYLEAIVNPSSLTCNAQ
jgi:predicted small lipoprotein YifL